MKKNIVIFAVIMIISSALVSAVGCSRDEAVVSLDEERFLQDPQTDIKDERSEVALTGPEELIEPAGVTVYVCGAVNVPGVYLLNEGARIIDAINAAGGLSSYADECYVNQAMVLEDGQKIYIPTCEETEGYDQLPQDIRTQAGLTPSSRININTADAAALMTLPGIGEAKAALIIEYRTSNGRFETIEDIMKISGIKEGMFNKIKDRICI